MQQTEIQLHDKCPKSVKPFRGIKLGTPEHHTQNFICKINSTNLNRKPMTKVEHLLPV